MESQNKSAPSHTLSHHLAVFLKAAAHLVRKARPLFHEGKPIGYKVPLREMQRVSTKLGILQQYMHERRQRQASVPAPVAQGQGRGEDERQQ